MGQEIVYCFKCLRRLTSADFERAGAVRFENNISCKECLPELLAAVPPEERKDLIAKLQGGPPKSGSRNPLPPPSTRRQAAAKPRPPRKSGSMGVVVAAGAGAVALILVIVIWATSSRPEPVAVPPPSTHPPPPATENPREKAGRLALEKARRVPAADLEARIAAYAEAERATEGTRYSDEAREAHMAVVALRSKAFAAEFAPIAEQVRIAENEGRFRAALDLLEGCRGKHSLPQWKGFVDARVQETRRALATSFAALKQQAVDAARAGAAEEVRKIREKVAQWTMPDLSEELEKSVAATPPADRPWRALFDGKTNECLGSQSRPFWTVSEGALVRVPGTKDAAQVKHEFEDGEFRFRFEASDCHLVGFSVRQGMEGSWGVSVTRAHLAAHPAKPVEVIFVCNGPSVTATFEGKPLEIEGDKRSRKGGLQFSHQEGTLRLLSIDYRPLVR